MSQALTASLHRNCFTTTCPITTCPPPTSVSGYAQYYASTGHLEAYSNPGNSDPFGHPPIIYTLSDYAEGDCTGALEACAYDAANPVDESYVDQSFDLYDSIAQNSWMCETFYGTNSDTSAFVVDPTVGNVFGYSR